MVWAACLIEATFLDEPQLDFGAASHVDVRFGIQRHGVLDFDDPANRNMRVGIVGTRETIDSLTRWIDSIGGGVAAKESNQVNLFPAFPGISVDHSFHLTLDAGSELTSVISKRDIESLLLHSDGGQFVTAAASMFNERVRQIQEDKRVHVVLCAVPLELAERTLGISDELDGKNFHHALKAMCLGHNSPTQIILPHTYDPSKKIKRKTKETVRTIQDEATRAWNFITALYYKGGGTPWRMKRLSSSVQTCYIGIGFYRLLDGSALQASIAQVFDELGEGVIVRGAMASVYKDDRHPYLEAFDAHSLLLYALREYRARHGHAPARVVLHKSSPFRPEEIEGFDQAVDEERIEMRSYVAISDSSVRLFRNGQYPPLRGTLLELSDSEAVLYTTGSNNFYQTYPGQYIPRPIQLRVAKSDDSIARIGEDILALSKMNWNKTQMDGSLPITLEAARQVGNILKYVDGTGQVQNTYRYFM